MSAGNVVIGPVSLVGYYADLIIDAMRADVAAGTLPASLSDFGEADLFVDRNVYFIEVGQTYDPDVAASVDEANAIHEELDRRIRDGALVIDQLLAAETEVLRVVDLYGSWERYQQTLRSLCR